MWASPMAQQVKNPPATQETQETEVRSLDREDSLPEKGNGNPLQYSCLENPMDCSPLGSFVQRILRAKILEWIATSFSRGSS